MLGKPVIGPVTSAYGPRDLPSSPFHSGQDYGWLYAQPDESRKVYAPSSGKAVVGRNDLVGNFVSLPIGDGHSTRLCHLESVAVTNGQTVTRGQYLGRMGNTGTQAVGVHLHVDVYNPDGQRVNPALHYSDTFVNQLAQTGNETTPILPEREEPDMPVFIRPNLIAWPNGYVSSYRADIFEACRLVAQEGDTEASRVATFVREQWKTVDFIATTNAKAVSAAVAAVVDAELDEAAISAAIIAALPKPPTSFTVTPNH